MYNNRFESSLGRAISSNNRLESSLGWAISGLHKIDPFNRVTSLIGMTCVFLMSAIIFTDVLLRYVFHNPIPGSLDIIEMTLVVAVFLGIAQAQHLHAHVSVDLVTQRLQSKPRLILSTITCLLSIGMFALLSWHTFEFALDMLKENRVTHTLFIPWWPFAFVVFLGCTALLIVLLQEFLYNILESVKGNFGTSFWFIMLGIATFVVAALTLWTLLPVEKISLPVIGIISLALFFLFFFTGMPIAFVMILVAFTGTTRIAGTPAAFDILGSTFFTSTANFTWAVIALFVLMAYFCLVSQLGSNVFETANKWIGHISGGLSIGTVAASTAFAAIVGDPSTPAVAIGSVAIPEMRKFKYSDELATGAILAGATIGAMIPPSLGFILYGLLADVSVGDLFVAGIIPGLMLSLSFIALIYIRCRLNPILGPPAEKWGWRERIISLKSGGPIALLFVIVIGGIYLGVFTPSEGGGVGAFGAFLIALFMRRLNWRRFTEALTATGRLTALGFMLIGGAMLLSYLFALSRLPEALMDFISGLSVPSIVVIVVILFVYLVLGCVMDPIPLLLLTVPIFAPVVVSLGYDPVWLGVLVILTGNVGFITPPYAGSIFILKGAFPEIPLGTMYKGVIPFVLASVIVIAIVAAFPVLATWIPYLM